ncbi:MAG: hypothetical protein HY707_04380 [Ignavibacteriae bacterium]|nr:hypothetical protein [Ignavibacteriota bacterium]
MVGCTNHSMSLMDDVSSAYFSVIPNDGDTNVPLDATIVLTFAKSVDRTVVEQNVHLISELAMADSLCPVNDSMGHGMMQMAMIDSTKMNHLVDQHSMRGRFEWNDASTRCAFRPDSLMMPNMQYMIHMGREMMRMMENRMGNVGMMGGHGESMMSEDMMYHFRTIDTH